MLVPIIESGLPGDSSDDRIRESASDCVESQWQELHLEQTQPIKNRRGQVPVGFVKVGFPRQSLGPARDHRVAGELFVWLGLAETDHLVALLVETTLLEDFDALETLQNVALGGDGALTFEAAMLGHMEILFGEREADYTDILQGEKGKFTRNCN